MEITARLVCFLLPVCLLYAGGESEKPSKRTPPPDDGIYRIEEIQVEADRVGKGIDGEPFATESLLPLEVGPASFDVGSAIAFGSVWADSDLTGRAGAFSETYLASAGTPAAVLLDGLLPIRFFNGDLSLFPLIGLSGIRLQRRSSLVMDSSAATGTASLDHRRSGDDEIDIFLSNRAFPVKAVSLSPFADQQNGGFVVARRLDRLSLTAAGSFRRAADAWDEAAAKPGRFALAAGLGAAYRYPDGQIDLFMQDARGRDGLSTFTGSTTDVDRESRLAIADWKHRDLFLPGSRLETAAAVSDQIRTLIANETATDDQLSRQAIDAAVDFRAPINDYLSIIARAGAGIAATQSGKPDEADFLTATASFVLQMPIAFPQSLMYPTFRVDRGADASVAPSASFSAFLMTTELMRLWIVLASGQRPPDETELTGTFDGRLVGQADLKSERDNNAAVGLSLSNFNFGDFQLSSELEASIHYRLDALARGWDASASAYHTENFDEVLVNGFSVSAAGRWRESLRAAISATLSPSFVLRDGVEVFETAPALPGLSLFTTNASLRYDDGVLAVGIGCRMDVGATLDLKGTTILPPAADLRAEFGYTFNRRLTVFAVAYNIFNTDDPFPTTTAPFSVEFGARWHE